MLIIVKLMLLWPTQNTQKNNYEKNYSKYPGCSHYWAGKL
jgi:hypothetical protein